MPRTYERRREEEYAQAHGALRKAATIVAPALAEAQTGLVVILDVAGMGRVNAHHGVATGDRLLRAVEDSLRCSLIGTGQVARLAGDQFLVVLPGAVSVDSAVGSILRAITRARVRGRWGRSVRVTAGVGAAAWHDAASRRTVISAAGRALSKTNRRGAATGS
jgi:diguanylate cyclase (GGDEF)-like protein